MSDSDNTGPIETIEEETPHRVKRFRPTKQARQPIERRDRHAVRQTLHGVCNLLSLGDIDVATHPIQGHFSPSRHTAVDES